LGQIVIDSFNPYAARFPGRRVISKEALDLAKHLRASGHQVSIGDGDGELNLLAQRGVRDFLSNPLFVFLTSIPVSVATGLIATYIASLFKKEPKPISTNIVRDGVRRQDVHPALP